MTKGEFVQWLDEKFGKDLDWISNFSFTSKCLEVWVNEPGEFGNSTSKLVAFDIDNVKPSLEHLALNWDSNTIQYSHQGIRSVY